MKIGLLGASFDTGNLGVSALAESSVQCILHKWPQAKVDLLASGRTFKKYTLEVEGKAVEVENLPVRFCKNIFMWNHYIVLFSTAVLLKIFRFQAARDFFLRRNPHLGRILEMDLVADITGGDSFSDIYGTRRFVQGALLKYLWLLFGIKFYFLPQTYGPFKRRWVRGVARFLLKRADRIYSRDQQGYDTIRTLFYKRPQILEKVCVVPDVAFILEPSFVQDSLTGLLDQNKQAGKTIIGINVNGLLYSGGYTKDNMFSLSVDYPAMIQEVVSAFLEDRNVLVLLVPHVCPSSAYQVECDVTACQRVQSHVASVDKDRVLLAGRGYSHRSVKSVIGRCDFFIGSRMHSCIAAMSQCIPSVGLAYSDKFRGVFESVGQGKNIVDLRAMEEKSVVEFLLKKYTQRGAIRDQLSQSIPLVQAQIISLIKD